MGGIIEITIPYELWDNTSTDLIQLPKGTYKALIENPSKVLYIHVIGTTREDILNTLQAIRVINSESDGTYIFIEFKNIANEFLISPDDTINFHKASSGETWVLNETLSDLTIDYTTADKSYPYISNGTRFIYINRSYSTAFGGIDLLTYWRDVSSTNTIDVYDSGTWNNEAYRTITFEEAVTDSELLAWLEANGVKQA
jgi:hypothetical protein